MSSYFESANVVKAETNRGDTGERASTNEEVELWKVVRPLDTIVSFMNTGAHPDDEFSALLAYLSLGKGVRTSSVIANRGEGGQNEIGNELGNGLGIVRSLELQGASKVTNIHLSQLSRELDDAIYDFGFSKSPEETLEKWGEEVTYERLIREIREQRPDILYPSFRDVPSQHGHHRAMNQLTVRAFRDAADPAVFPEQLAEGLSPWQPRKLYLPGTKEEETLHFNIGTVDAVYGKTYPQLGEDSRYLHKSQGMGRDLPVEDYYVSLYLADSVVNSGRERTIFDALPYDFADYGKGLSSKKWKKALPAYQRQLDRVVAAYPNKDNIVKQGRKALLETRALLKAVDKDRRQLPEDTRVDLMNRLLVKEQQLQRASAVASDVQLTLQPKNMQLTRGAETDVTFTVHNKGAYALTNVHVKPTVPKGWEVTRVKKIARVKPGEKRQFSFRVKVAKDAAFFRPYDDAVLRATVSYSLKGVRIAEQVDPADPVAVLPDFGLQLTPEKTMFNLEKNGESLSVQARVTNYVNGRNDGYIAVNAPDGWRVAPERINVAFKKQGEQEDVRFVLTPTADTTPGTYTIDVTAHNAKGSSFSTQVQPIQYDHIGRSYWLRDSQVTVEAFPLKMVEGLKVGYVDSGFDGVAEALKQAGMDVTLLSERDLASGDLSRYDTIVVGIRAYLSRDDLRAHNDRLLDYVKRGGHVVMQYHKPGDNWSPQLSPFPLQPGEPSIQWRVTDETAPVTILAPEHPVFHAPNAIAEADFDGWVQERGLYFPSSWDKAYTPLLSMADPGEEPFTGGLLTANYGEGSYVYTSLVWYRQIQSQIPGGYRMFVNLISYPHVQ